MWCFSKKTQKRDGKPKKSEDHLQHIPFRLREIMKSKDKMKAGAKKLRKGEQKFFQTPMNIWLYNSDKPGVFLTLQPPPLTIRSMALQMETYLSHISEEDNMKV